MKKIFLENWPQKIFALFLAVFIWAQAFPTRTDLTEVQLFISIVYLNLDKDLVIVSEPLRSTSIAVEISQNRRSEIHPSLFQAVVDLKEFGPGKHTIEIDRNNIEGPPDAGIKTIVPSSIEIELEDIIEKILKIKPVIVGKPATDYVLGDVEMIPESVKIRGRVSTLKKMEEIETRPINVENLNSDVEMLTTLNLAEGIDTVDTQDKEPIARIKVSSEPMNIRLIGIPIGQINQVFLTRINPQKLNLLLRGPKSLLQNFTKNDAQIVLDLSDFTPGEHKIEHDKKEDVEKPLRIRIPAAIQVQKIWPPIDIWVLKQRVNEEEEPGSFPAK